MVMRVLVVERDRAWGRTLAGLLRGAGLAVDVAEDGDGSDRRPRGVPYDAVLLGVPAGAREELALLRRWGREGRAAPVVAVEGSGAAGARARALDAGADDALSRPFPVPELVARLRALVRRYRPAKPSVLRLHDLEIDTAARAVKRGGRPIHLTPREYALLEFLASHPGRFVSRSLIEEHLYGGQNRSGSNVVEVYIGYLRNKIDRGFDRPLILTRRGYGYSLAVPEQAVGVGA